MSESSKKSHDLVVIGGGPGGYVAAIRAAQLGLNVACVEKESLLGGTCLRVGCIPSKAMLESSEVYAEAKEGLAKHGVKATGVEFDLKAMLKRKEEVVGSLAKGIDSLFASNKVTRYRGVGSLNGPGKVVVKSDKESIELTAKNIMIATGSKVAPLKGVELNGDLIGTSTEALAYPAVPGHLVVIGAGYIGMEMGSVWRRLGAKVTVLEYLDRILPGMDAAMARDAKRAFDKQGFDFQLQSRVTAARLEKGKPIVEVEGRQPIRADRVLLAVGRVPNTDGLGLETVGIELDKQRRIPVNDKFETSQPGVFAIGDVIRGPMLAHKAEKEGVACIERLVTGYGKVNYDVIPAVVFTHPEIATVGKTEEQLKEERIEYRKGIAQFRANGRARTLGETDGHAKVLAHAKTDRILGVHIIGPRAGDLIAEAAVAMEFGASSEDLALCCHAHPTLPEVLKEAALAVRE